jgi:hypothetical protein
MTPLEVGLIIAAFSVAFAALLAFTVRQNGRLQELEVKYSVLSTQVSPLWAQVQSRIAADLHQPHPRYAETDNLLAKLEALTITPEERVRLNELLVARSKDMSEDVTDMQRREASLMIQVMHIVVMEARNIVTVVLAWLGVHLHLLKR